jgi:quercetin dioxygenase-like cupin family protein
LIRSRAGDKAAGALMAVRPLTGHRTVLHTRWCAATLPPGPHAMPAEGRHLPQGPMAMLEQTETTVPIVSLPSADGVNVLDGRSRVLVRPDAVNDAYAMLEQTIPPGKGPPLHVHRHETEIFYVIEGTFEFRVAGDRFVAGPGTNVVGPRDIPHTFRNVGETPGKLLLTIIPGRFGNYFSEVDSVADHDRAAIERLTAKYDVALLE